MWPDPWANEIPKLNENRDNTGYGESPMLVPKGQVIWP